MGEDSSGDQLELHKELKALFEKHNQLAKTLREYKKLKALFEQHKQVDSKTIKTKEWKVFFSEKTKESEMFFSYSEKTKEKKQKSTPFFIVLGVLIIFYLKYCHK